MDWNNHNSVPSSNIINNNDSNNSSSTTINNHNHDGGATDNLQAQKNQYCERQRSNLAMINTHAMECRVNASAYYCHQNSTIPHIGPQFQIFNVIFIHIIAWVYPPEKQTNIYLIYPLFEVHLLSQFFSFSNSGGIWYVSACFLPLGPVVIWMLSKILVPPNHPFE